MPKKVNPFAALLKQKKGKKNQERTKDPVAPKELEGKPKRAGARKPRNKGRH